MNKFARCGMSDSDTTLYLSNNLLKKTIYIMDYLCRQSKLKDDNCVLGCNRIDILIKLYMAKASKLKDSWPSFAVIRYILEKQW